MKRFVSLICLLILLSLGGKALAYSVSLVPNFQSIQTGDTAQVDVNISVTPGVPPPELFGFNLGLAFNPAVLRFDNLLFGNQVNAAYLASFTPPSKAYPDFIAFDGGLDFFSGLGGITADTTLASLFFTGVGPGTSSLDLYGTVLDVNMETGLVTVGDLGRIDVTQAPAPVPEPGTFLLLGSALAGMAGLRRKLQRA